MPEKCHTALLNESQCHRVGRRTKTLIMHEVISSCIHQFVYLVHHNKSSTFSVGTRSKATDCEFKVSPVDNSAPEIDSPMERQNAPNESKRTE